MKRLVLFALGLAAFGLVSVSVVRHVRHQPQTQIAEGFDVPIDETAVASLRQAAVPAPEDDGCFEQFDELELALGARPALASDVWKATLASIDAGATNVAAIPLKSKASIQCETPACYHTGTTSAVVPDCSKDFWVEAAPRMRDFETGAHGYIAAKALDAGNPACRVFWRTENP